MKDTITRFIDCHIPTETCNLRCSYCYITQKRKFENKIGSIDHSPEEIRVALSKKRLGGAALINMCAGGETLLSDEVLPVIYALIEEGHYIQIVTNGTMSKRFEEISKWPIEILNKLFIKFSFHYLELVRLRKMDEYFKNINLVKDAGASITLELTPCDEEIPYIDEIKKVSVEKLGAYPHVTVTRNEETSGFEILTKYSKEEYVDKWSSFDSEMFNLKMKLLSEKRTEYCYGGEWTFYLDLKTGKLKQCYRGAVIDNIYEDVLAPLRFKPIGRGCPEQYCYNGHAWMTLGCIPVLDLPTYADMRDRICKDGSSWLSPSVKGFFSQKLGNQHTVYTEKKK